MGKFLNHFELKLLFVLDFIVDSHTARVKTFQLNCGFQGSFFGVCSCFTSN